VRDRQDITVSGILRYTKHRLNAIQTVMKKTVESCTPDVGIMYHDLIESSMILMIFYICCEVVLCATNAAYGSMKQGVWINEAMRISQPYSGVKYEVWSEICV